MTDPFERELRAGASAIRSETESWEGDARDIRRRSARQRRTVLTSAALSCTMALLVLAGGVALARGGPDDHQRLDMARSGNEPAGTGTSSSSASTTLANGTSSTTAPQLSTSTTVTTMTPPQPAPTTTTSTTTATTTSSSSTTTTAAPKQIVLRGDGLGVASFGDDPEATMAALVTVLGPPDFDTGWIENSATTEGPHRYLTWGPEEVASARFSVEFSPRASSDGTARFAWWDYRPGPGVPRLSSVAGLAPGVTAGELRSRYTTHTQEVEGGKVLCFDHPTKMMCVFTDFDAWDQPEIPADAPTRGFAAGRSWGFSTY